MSTYAQFQNAAASEKIVLVRLECAKRLMGWVLDADDVYYLDGVDFPVVAAIEQAGVALTPAESAAVAPGEYYFDRAAGRIYLQASGSTHPNTEYIAATFAYFFADAPGVTLPYDLGAGKDVLWLPLVQGTSQFGVELDLQNQLGLAIEGAGQLNFYNDLEFWQPRFDRLYWENQRALVFSWSRNLPAAQAKLIYRGRVQGKAYSKDSVSFTLKDFLNELRAPVQMPELGAIEGVRVPENRLRDKQRLVYGWVRGHKPVNINQVVNGFAGTGTLAITQNAQIITGTGTAFLSEVTPGDDLFISEVANTYTVASVDSNTQITLSEVYSDRSVTTSSFVIRPKAATRLYNREFLLAGHAIREPSTTVSAAVSPSMFRAVDPSDLYAGDEVIVNGEAATIRRVTGNMVKLEGNLAEMPSFGSTVVRPAVTNVYLDDRKLTVLRDYTYDAATGRLTLDPLAEVNIAAVQALRGTVTFTNNSRTVSGSATSFTQQLKPNDWIRPLNSATYMEVLAVVSDTELHLRAVWAAATTTQAARFKVPPTYLEGKSVLSLDMYGATEDGTPAGRLIATGPQIVRDLLSRAGLAGDLNVESFETAEAFASQRLGIAIPEKAQSAKSPAARDVINQVNLSVLGSLVQNEDFLLEYQVLEPAREDAALKITETDVLGFSVVANSERIVKTVRVEYGHREHDPLSGGATSSNYEWSSDAATYLARTAKEHVVVTRLVDEADAEIAASRWAFLMEVSSSVVKIQTKLQAARLQVSDRVMLTHHKLYQRQGSTSLQKMAAAQSVRKSAADVELELEDLANAFSRAGVIAPDDAPDWDAVAEDSKIHSGYITDDHGMIENDPETYGINLIW